jgi:CelD/BcsL family acetyltransferase involved in cellulose biosynthesis
MERLRPAWEKLYASSESSHTLFQSFAWNHLAAKIFATRESPYIVLIENDNGAMLVPASVRKNEISLIGETLFDYRDILHAGDPSLIRRGWETLAKLGRPFRFAALRGAAAAKWSGLPLRSFCFAPRLLTGETSADAFEAEHRRSARLLRRLERNGIELKAHFGSDSALVSTIYCRKAMQFAGGKTNLFRDPLRTQFMMHACALQSGVPDMLNLERSAGAQHMPAFGRCESSAVLGDELRCEIFTMESSGVLAAALVTFIDRKTRRFYTVYFDPAWAKSSPGHALVYEVSRRSLAAGLDCDFMTGEAPYKTRLATSAVPLYQVEASPEMLARAAREELRPVA